ncbi:hypothetical protein C491_10039 [Natronococcus amylolyticus DSM 10524]|uniref:Uncharacterized protein n=1 Tax=Natronococcus amylolyticus DSM 10524 TaxID=1227497 RepID=L9X955_9EURY|nr:hypothetical protein [Natronococcus amylolyticus]ELY58127.1 hypothetical protein C491_10039 [Natronococcus amylolyticus DSM 10524]
MFDVLPTVPRSDRRLLAVSFALFAGAGAATAAGVGPAMTAGATALAVGGVYCVALYANRVSRPTLARLSLGLWIAFLGVAGLHLVGLETIAGAAPGSTTAGVHSLSALTWASLLLPCSTTVFLGFREYASSGADVADEQSLEGEAPDYSTR